MSSSVETMENNIWRLLSGNLYSRDFEQCSLNASFLSLYLTKIFNNGMEPEPPVQQSTKGNLLRELANFDIKAPISISISFEDDFDETPIKKEIETDDQKTTNSAFIPILEPKTEIGSDAVTPCILTEEQTDDFTAHDNIQDTSALQPESPVNPVLISETRKRKAVDVQMCKPKKNKTISDTADNCDDEISLQTFGSHTKENNIQPGHSLTTSENVKNESRLPNQSDQNLNGLHQTDLDKVNAYITNCLSSLSENMRLIMQAYGAHRRQQISKEDYINRKLLYFNSSYKTVVTMLVTQEDNNEFISTFLQDTLRRALKKNSFFIHTYQDYANLLVEMIAWSKREKRLTQKLSEKSEQLIPVQNGVISEPQVNKNPAQGSIHVNNSNTEGENVCIFSSGPPERALRINIDPRLNPYLQTTAQNDSAVTNHPPLSEIIEYDGDMTQGKAAVDCLARYVANHNKPTHQSVVQSTSPKTPNLVTTHTMQPLNSSYYMMNNIPNYSIPSQQKRDITPVLRMQLGKAPLQSNLIQPAEPQRPPPRYGHSAPQTQHSTPPPAYGQSRHLQTQSGLQQHFPPQFYQGPVLQTQSKPTQFQQSQYLQAQLGPQYVQPQQLQSQLDQSHLPVLEHNQTRQAQQQPHPKITEHWPSLVEMLSTESTLPLPCPSNEQTQSALSGQWQSRNQQPQVQPPPAYRTEWQQGQNANFQVGQVPQQTQKGSSRSASTDSGFISPLNFNVSTDQTMPTMPQEPESTMPMIVHVTSLSNKASYVKLGKCVVCKKSTKQMCMGCMNMYYCNNECQSVDWAAHAPNCSQQNTN